MVVLGVDGFGYRQSEASLVEVVDGWLVSRKRWFGIHEDWRPVVRKRNRNRIHTARKIIHMWDM